MKKLKEIIIEQNLKFKQKVNQDKADDIFYRPSKSHSIISMFTNYCILGFALTFLAAIVGNIIDEPIPVGVMFLVAFVVLTTVFVYQIFSARTLWLSPGELHAGRIIRDGKKQWVNTYNKNRTFLFFVTIFSLMGVFNSLDRVSVAPILLKDIIEKTILAVLTMYAVVKVGSGKIKWGYLLFVLFVIISLLGLDNLEKTSAILESGDMELSWVKNIMIGTLIFFPLVNLINIFIYRKKPEYTPRPDESLEDFNKKEKNRASFWRIYFCFYVTIVLLGYMVIFSVTNKRIWEFVDIFFTAISIVGLYGFVWNRKVYFNKLFWKIFFLALIFWWLFYYLIITQLPEIKEIPILNNYSALVLSWLIMSPLLVGLYFYAYKDNEYKNKKYLDVILWIVIIVSLLGLISTVSKEIEEQVKTDDVQNYKQEINDYGKSSLLEGGYYSVVFDDESYGVVKILKKDDAGLHIRLYKNTYIERPKEIKIEDLSLGSVDDQGDSGIGHLPLTYREFSFWEAEFVVQGEVLEEELDGYYEWQDSGGGYWDNSEDSGITEQSSELMG